MIRTNVAERMPQAEVNSRFAGIVSQEHSGQLGQTLEQVRLLTEVTHLYRHLNTMGLVPASVRQDVLTNLETGVCELAMPSAVTTTIHKVEHREVEGRRERVIMWLGKTAVENAANGYVFHKTPAAHKRVELEVQESAQVQRALRKGTVQVFLSPKMSASDAPVHIAKAEHLADEDSIRTSHAVTNARGEVTARKLQSLLVNDIPLSDWYAWLKSSENIFGQAFNFDDETSALPIMELSTRLELPEELVPEGPVSIVASILPFIQDPALQQSVARQLNKFRRDQETYKAQATETAQRWLAFELELARSLKAEQATPEIRNFIVSLQDQWGDKQQSILTQHNLGNAHFRMSEELAAMLEAAKQNLLGAEAGVAVGEEKILRQMSTKRAAELTAEVRRIKELKAQGAPEHIIAQGYADLNRNFARENLKVGGACIGNNEGEFKKDNPLTKFLKSAFERLLGKDKESEEERIGKKRKGKCVVDSCPTRPREVTVGGCGVCLERCQKMFDQGVDPTLRKAYENKPANKPPTTAQMLASVVKNTVRAGQAKSIENPSAPKILSVVT